MYLVSVPPAVTRVLKTDGIVVQGHGSRLKRSALSGIFNELEVAAEAHDTKDDREVIHTWRRRHSNGWLSVVDQRRNGRFWGGALPQRGPHFNAGTMGDYATLDEAKADGDRALVASGHSCDDRCGVWEQE